MFNMNKYKRLLNNLGKKRIEDNYIIIDVDNNTLKKMLKLTNNILYINSNILKERFEKPIIYNIKNMNFEKISIISDEGVTFNNCNFIDGVNIFQADSIVFNNNNYINLSDEYNDSFFTGKSIASIIFYDEQITDQNVAFRIKSKNIKLIDTVLLKDNGHTNFKCNRLSMNNSTIGGSTSLIDSKSMYLKKQSSIHNTKNCIIECPEIKGDNNFIAPRVILNGKEYIKEKKKIKDLK